MKRFFVLMVLSTVAVGAAGCRSYNWFERPSATPMMPAITYGSPGPQSGMYVDPLGTPQVASPAPCGPGCTSCGNTVPTLSGAQGYSPAPKN
jgi:hypothetical protein